MRRLRIERQWVLLQGGEVLAADDDFETIRRHAERLEHRDETGEKAASATRQLDGKPEATS